MNCLFCAFCQNTAKHYRIYEDEHVIAFLDIAPADAGHTLIIPRAHAENLFQNTREVQMALLDALNVIAKRLKERLGCDGFNVYMNQGACASQVIFHTHLHLIPRYAKEGMHDAGDLAAIHALITR